MMSERGASRRAPAPPNPRASSVLPSWQRGRELPPLGRGSGIAAVAETQPFFAESGNSPPSSQQGPKPSTRIAAVIVTSPRV